MSINKLVFLTHTPSELKHLSNLMNKSTEILAVVANDPNNQGDPERRRCRRRLYLMTELSTEESVRVSYVIKVLDPIVKDVTIFELWGATLNP